MKKGSYFHYIYSFFMETRFSSSELKRDVDLVKKHRSVFDVFNQSAICLLPKDVPFRPQPPRYSDHVHTVWTLF